MRDLTDCKTCHYWRRLSGMIRNSEACHFALDLGICRSTICYAGECKSAGVWKPKERGVVSEKKETADL